MKAPLAFRIREELSDDQHEVRKVNEAAFEHAGEADLVDNLRAEGVVLLSLVAELDGEIVGHILFTRMTIETAQGPVQAVSLAPMAVIPERQRCQVGSSLVRHGLDTLRERGERIVLVLGHKDYYPRFGFAAAKAKGLSSPFPPDAYMALELSEGALTDVRGLVRYAPAFGL
jgi:putative acetyltransferase